jgi:hypothetical protein
VNAEGGGRSELIRLLEAELDLIEGGGYGQRAGGAGAQPRMFDRSLVCIDHWFVPGVDSGCQQECTLMSFVPEAHRKEQSPCHYIVLNDKGETVHSLEGDQARLEREVKQWLRRVIQRLKTEEQYAGPDVKY